ncbi:MAG: carbohydrate kinase family protein [Polyangiaceae bacterium]
MTQRIVSWGETLWDLYEHERLLGGCAANVAVHLTQLGADAHLVTRVGNDELGAAAIEALAARGLDTSHVQVDLESPTGCVQVRIEKGQPRFSLAHQAAWDHIELTPALQELLGAADALVFGTLAQRTPLGFTTLREAVALTGARFRVCDLNIRQPWASPEAIEQSVSLANVIKLNAKEAETLRQIYGIENVCAWLLSRGTEIVALTLDAQGSELHTARSCIQIPPYAVIGSTIDAVGAGDAYTAVLTAHLVSGSPLQEAGEAASQYAAAVVGSPGATPQIPTEILAKTRPGTRRA